MSDQAERMTEGQESFLGEVSHPSLLPTSLPRIGGLIEFMVHPLHRRGRIEAGSLVQLISVSGHVYPAIIRGWGFLAPNYSRPPRWQIGDFLIAIEGITLDQAKEVTQVRWEAHSVPEDKKSDKK